ncbi:MAG TPA: tetratricopeptide repeat-containing protein kinase family protein, partial [Kofleriaceae bacterium]|nr:tetratricopeptide repeat-containing protein kinase family protein [Kofleriaceae bacterium]
HARMTNVGHVLGTPVYMSPEQHAGEPATARSDQYSFCVSLWEALYREHPFAGAEWTPAAVARMALDEVMEPSRRGGVPARVERALRRGLRHDPAARWPSMVDLVDEIAPRSRAGWVWGAVALVGIAAAVVLTAWLMKAPDRSKICAAEADKVRAVWPGKRVPISDAAMAANLDAYAGELATRRVDACEASDASTPLQLHCLDDALHALDDFVGDFATGSDAQYLARQLPPLADCSSSAQAMLAPIPAGASTKVETIRLALSRARVIRAVGNGHKAAPSVDTAVADARALGYAPLTAEALLVRAQLLDDKLDPDAGPVAAEAAELAVTAHADRTAATAYTLAVVEAADRAEFARLDVLVPVARAAAVRVGTPEVLGSFDHAASRAAVAEARYGEAHALCIDALAQIARTTTTTWEADKQHDAVVDDAYSCFTELSIGRGALRAGMRWTSAWLAHLEAAFQSAKPIAGFGAQRAKLELDYHAGDYAKAVDGIRYQMAGVEVTTGIDKGVATFDDVATMERMYRDAGQRSGAVVEARTLLAIAKANPLDARRLIVAEIVRGDLAALTDDRAAMYTHYATALADADKLFRPDDDRRAEIRFRIAQAYAQDGAADRADALFQEALAIWQRTGSPHAFDALAERAALREEQGDCAAAIAG